MTTGASAEPRAGCPSCLWEGPGTSAFCSDESAFFATCRSAEDDGEPPLPAPQPTEKLAASAARMRKANAPCATLRKSVLVPISSLPPHLFTVPTVIQPFQRQAEIPKADG